MKKPQISPMYRLLAPVFLFRLLVFFSLMCLPTSGFGQEQEPKKRPKIGLVLSGGGAKGIAHIGVLKALEEAGITPDYITGTSMGSIMGGLYASGYTADQIEDIVLGMDWDLTLTNNLPLDKITIEEKFYYGRYLMDFYLQDKKLVFPDGLIDSEALMQQFSRFTAHVSGTTDFNDLPIPFACVATDIETGEPVVLNKGSLIRSMRASMAIPTVFTPVEIDNHYLVDGGLVRNMPVEEALDMGADIIIGVFVSGEFMGKDEMNSMLSILTQSAFITSVRDSREQLEMCDIVIKPNLDGYSTGSFHEAAGILRRGKDAGVAYAEVFKKLSDSLNSIAPAPPIDSLRRFPRMQKEYLFTGIEIEGNSVIPDNFILGKMDLNLRNPISLDELEQKIDHLYGTQYFSKAWYEIKRHRSNLILKLNVTERPKVHFKFSYHYNTENGGGIVANTTLRNVAFNNSRLIFEADLSKQPKLNLDYFKYVGSNQDFAVGASSTFKNEELPIYNQSGGKNSLYNSTYFDGALKLQSTRHQNSTFGALIKWEYNALSKKVLSESVISISNLTYLSTKYAAFYSHNSLNDRYFPTRGSKFDFLLTTAPHIGGSIVLNDTIKIDASESNGAIQTSTVNSIKLMGMHVYEVNSKLSIIGKARLNISNLHKDAANLGEFDFIGGFFPDIVQSTEYYGAGINEFATANYFYGRITSQYEWKRNLFLQAHLNYVDSKYPSQWVFNVVERWYGTSEQNKFKPTDLGGRTNRFGYGLSVGYRSMLGPVVLSVAQDAHRRNLKAALSVGFYY